MRYRINRALLGPGVLALLVSLAALAENIDPANNGSQYAYAENVGWINAEPSGDGGPGVQVGDSELSGSMWGENIGWINLSCQNTLSCATANYGVANDGSGVLSGFAYAENVGWINFAPSTAGVSIDPATGDFSGRAWGENIGWITFASSGANPFKVTAGWICTPRPPAPSSSPLLTLAQSDVLSWSAAAGATAHDIVGGNVSTLGATGGDFSLATAQCLDDDRTTTSLLSSGTPAVGQAFWFLVRGVNCGGDGTYDSGLPSQVGLRDAEIAASGNGCS